MQSSRMPQLLGRGVTVKAETGHQYVVTRRLGEGQFAEVWEVKQCTGSDLRFALKLEKFPERKSVLHETKVLSKLPGKCEQVVSVIDTGFHGKSFFMIMELLGDTLFDARKQAGGRMDLPSVKAVGLSTLAAIEGLHCMGFIHRDIKPANFVINPPNAAASRGKWVLIDFGLARKYVNEDGSHMAARSDASFRGSTAYASVHAHRNEDLSRRDDLWSWFYMLLELVEGVLLWRLEKDDPRDHDKQWVLHEKEKSWQQPELLARGKLPDALLAIHAHIKGLGFESTPDYQHLRTCLQQLPDEQVQLQLAHLIPAAAAHQAVYEQNGMQQPPWDNSPLQQQYGQQQYGQQQQQQYGQPPSPYVDGMSPMGSLGLVGTGAKRPRSSSAGGGDMELQAKRLRPESASAPRQGWSQQQQQQQQRPPRHASSSSPCDADDSRGDSRQGSLGTSHRASQEPPPPPPPPPPAVTAAAAAAAGDQHKQQQQQQQPLANGIEQVPPGPQQGTAAANAAAVGDGGRASEIAELLVAYDREAPVERKAATQQAVAGLCSLGPLDAVCAISMTLDRLVKQSDVSCMPHVSQLLLDLAAFAASGASEAGRAAAKAASGQGS